MSRCYPRTYTCAQWSERKRVGCRVGVGVHRSSKISTRLGGSLIIFWYISKFLPVACSIRLFLIVENVISACVWCWECQMWVQDGVLEKRVKSTLHRQRTFIVEIHRHDKGLHAN